ncbi:ubiquinol-cytochrome c reductase iron-sulfur subunit [Helicobacter mustelae]|uniref:Putative ubiquinol-cytochrome C reductase iron-sulfur subunit n=1 Tax=Helicobacter mustelae (strain ATCC 43772 / CCUG 25715 / CIP 103759 / LMG 18044 / NCTC 12198 / R85-136P) TaxID=679897 RepID=D3UGP4_HELM1|nr:ubiquinol-cytochrome c reductase iron-sulfur subunit [Helicobacter mustelae]CBG39665.1 putative ubiquinol-cytochrome C reductase iron-sulfur subunit [Helicobacter mustelae 12198]SQH71173.1 ubiquinol-cytochrome C reductase iron-sulfur subunit [Helicobacter mustelae]STP12301.1 ubiquinol-cytochrome C reductase iron-sulfur subunit [Helicobacter mustelae]
MAEVKRRDFLGMALGGVTALGAVASLIAMKKTWDPLPSVVAAGFTTVDVGGMKEGEFSTTAWRGKPIYIIKKKAGEEFNQARDFKVGEGVFTMGIQICTHLGCIPIFHPDKSEFLCPCHGGRFTLDGVNIAGTPPPRPFEIPPFKIDGTKLVLGEVGSEYKAMIAKA